MSTQIGTVEPTPHEFGAKYGPMPYPASERGFLTRAQVERLVQAIAPNAVEAKQGLTYIAQHEARAEMTRIFGFGNWDSDVTDLEMIYEYSRKGTGQNSAKDYWLVAYRARVTVRIRDYWGRPIAEFSEYHAEENAPQPQRGEAHALAMTSVASYALRRALIGLGDRFGLGLYAGGSTAALVKGTLQLSDADSPLARAQAATPEQAAAESAAMREVSPPSADQVESAVGQVADAFNHGDKK